MRNQNQTHQKLTLSSKLANAALVLVALGIIVVVAFDKNVQRVQPFGVLAVVAMSFVLGMIFEEWLESKVTDE
jgi:uncharacterized membrane protein YqjE